MHELILGGAKSGKSSLAQRRAIGWLAQPGRSATLIATALAGDTEMAERIARHRADRAALAANVTTVEEPRAIAAALGRLSTPINLVIVDCLTLWLTQLTMPIDGGEEPADVSAATDALEVAMREAKGPVILVSNEIGFGVAPMTPQARRFVDELGLLHQRMATVCDRVTLMVAGLPLTVKESPTHHRLT